MTLRKPLVVDDDDTSMLRAIARALTVHRFDYAIGSAQCRSMAELVAAVAAKSTQSARERAVLQHLSQSWTALAWATDLLEKHGVDIAPFQPPDEVNTSGLSACLDVAKV